MQANAFSASFGRNFRYLSKGIISLILVCLLASCAMAANITCVNVQNKSDRVVISVVGSAPLRMSVITSSAGNYLGFQFPGKLVSRGRLVGIHSGRIYSVRYSRFQENPPLARIVMNTSSHLDYSTEWNDDKSQVDITVWKFGANRKLNPADKQPEALSVSKANKPEPKLECEPISKPVAETLPVSLNIEPVKANTRSVRTTRVAPAAALIQYAQIGSMPASSGAGRKVSLNFLGADISDVLKALAVQSGENIVIGSDVSGTITVTLENVTVEEALDYITQLSGYTYIKDQHTFLVGSTNMIGGLTNAKVEIITLAYTNADDVLEILKTQCPNIRANKISVRGGKARKHDQTFAQGNSKADAQGQSNINNQGESNINAQGQADVNAQGKSNGNNKSASGNASIDATGGASGKTSSNAKGNMNINARVGQEALASSASNDSPPSDMIALVGPAEKIAPAKAFIAQIEESMKSQAGEKKISLYQVKYVNTQELANTIMSLTMGVTVALAPSDAGNTTESSKIKLVPVNLLSGETANRAFDTETVSSSHTLIFVGREADVQKALEMAAQFDIPGESELSTYKVKYVDVNLTAQTIRKLVPGVNVEGLNVTSSSGGDQNAASSDSGAKGESSTSDTSNQNTMTAASLDNLSRTLIITGRKSDVVKAIALAEALDIKSPQIKIEAKITSINEGGKKQLGLNWSWGKLSMNEGSIVTETVGTLTDHLFGGVAPGDMNADSQKNGTATANKNDSKQTTTYTKGNDKFYRSPLNFGATLDALVTNGSATVLASPNLLCLEGKSGKFFVGDDVTYISSVGSTASGEKTYQTSTVQAGVTLNVVGNVSPDGYITLSLHPEVSTYTLTTVGDVTVPTVSSRYTDSVVRVKNGTTLAIGGLIRSDEVKNMSKIPLLGDLPFFGKLFRHVDKSSSKDEVVMFITASIVKDQE